MTEKIKVSKRDWKKLVAAQEKADSGLAAQYRVAEDGSVNPTGDNAPPAYSTGPAPKEDTSLQQQARAWELINSHPAIQDYFAEHPRYDGTYMQAVYDRITGLAELAAEAEEAKKAYCELYDDVHKEAGKERYEFEQASVEHITNVLSDIDRELDGATFKQMAEEVVSSLAVHRVPVSQPEREKEDPTAYAWGQVIRHPALAKVNFREHDSYLAGVIARLDELVRIEKSVKEIKDEARKWIPAYGGGANDSSLYAENLDLRAEINNLKAERDNAEGRAERYYAAVRSSMDAQAEALSRAEKAEARIEGWREAYDALMENPCPVTLDEFEKSIDRWKLTGQNRGATLAEDLLALVSGSDPAVYVVRESDIEDCQRNEDGDWEFRHSGRVFFDSQSPKDRAESLAHHREQITQRVAIIRAIEAEQAVDPVEAKAIELHQVAFGGRIGFGHATLNAQEMFRILARHVLGQEADQ